MPLPRPSFLHHLTHFLADLFRIPYWLKALLAIALLVGYLLGSLFRAFTKIMALLTLLAAGAYAAISYFHLNAAPMATAATQEYHQASLWLSAQTSHLKTLFTTHLPSATATAAGLFFGIRKRNA